MLPCLVVVVNFWGVLEIAGDDGGTRNLAGAKVAIVVSPTLNVGLPILKICHSCGAHKEEHLLAVILVSHGVEFFPIDVGLKGDFGGRWQGAKELRDVVLRE